MVLPGSRGEDGENPTVTFTFSFPAMRSDDAIVNDTPFTCPNIAPEDNGSDGTVSVELSRCTEPPDVTVPITKPDIVMVTVDAGMGTPATVITSRLLAVGLHSKVRSLTLVLPAATLGTLDAAKNPEG